MRIQADAPELQHFTPQVAKWFSERFGAPTPPQRRAWPVIATGVHSVVAAPTGSGKTLTGFLFAIDRLLATGTALPDTTQVLYISPLRALGNDIQRNLEGPLSELAARDPNFPAIRVMVRSGDTPASQRQRMAKVPPHILVTTPESAYILLGSQSGRAMLSSVGTVIVDEVHAVLGDKRGAHLALTLERIEALTPRPPQRIGLSATQKPIEAVARFLVGAGRECATIDEGHRRQLDIAIEVPPSPLTPVCPNDVMEEIHERITALIAEHTTTLIFVETRKMAERVAARLRTRIGDRVVCHHGSLSKERRLRAESRLRDGDLDALVATASLELGIDIGDIDLVIQLGSTRTIATLLQRVGRSGHALGRTPKGRVFPLTPDELVEATALIAAIDRGILDVTPQPLAPIDVLAQQIVAACVHDVWSEDDLYRLCKRAWPYRDLSRDDFDAAVSLNTGGRRALLHHDGVHGRLRATRRARLVALTAGGAIPDRADYTVKLEPSGTVVGTVDEDFAIESTTGDIFQLGNASWRILKVESGVLRVADAEGAPPSLPFWFGEARARTRELAALIGDVRELALDRDALRDLPGLPEAAADQIHEYVTEGFATLGAIPTTRRVILERFFDESGGMQLVIHAPFGGRINRAWGLALRKKFCRSFGFELQAAANEDSIVISLGPQHSFELDSVYGYVKAHNARDTLVQAVLPRPMFTTRWRWNATRSLRIERTQSGKRVPAPLLRMRCDDLLVESFPQVVACGETLPPGDLPVPYDEPLVRQTIDDCLTEAMDIDGLIQVLTDLESGTIERRAVDTPRPSLFACSVLNAAPYAFLDDAPLEERRTQAVLQRRTLSQATVDDLGALDEAAVERVRAEAWPDPRDVEELHEALGWMGYVTDAEVDAQPTPWRSWLAELATAGRVRVEDRRYFATEGTRDAVELLAGRLEALGPIAATHEDERALLELEAQGRILRVRYQGEDHWCERRLLARIHRYTLDALRAEIRPVTIEVLLRFLTRWQFLDSDTRRAGPEGVLQVIRRLAGFEAPAATWERDILAPRVADYLPEWLDDLMRSGRAVWGRLWGSSKVAVRSAPISVVPRLDLADWLALSDATSDEALSHEARAVAAVIGERGAMFEDDLARATQLLPSQLEVGLGELVALGLLTNDSFAGLRRLLIASKRHASRRRGHSLSARWCRFRCVTGDARSAEFVAQALLERYGLVTRALLAREKQPIPWRDLLRVYRHWELRGDVRGGRFVEGLSGEQFALPDAINDLRHARKLERRSAPLRVSAVDPLNLIGIVTPDTPVPARIGNSIEL